MATYNNMHQHPSQHQESNNHNSPLNLEVEQMGTDDNRISDGENSCSEDTEVLLEFVNNEISNPYEVGVESRDISTTTSCKVFGVDISVFCRKKEEDEQQANHNVMQVPDNNHHSVVHYPEVNLEVEQMGRDDNRISYRENSYSEDTDVFLEHFYNEISNPFEVSDESREISTTTSCKVFGVDISVSRRSREEEEDEQQADHNIMQVPDNNHPSVVHYPEEVLSMIQGRHDLRPNYAHSYCDPCNEVNLEVEQMGTDDNRISDRENSYSEDTDVILEHFYNEISNPYEVSDESRDISTTESCRVFGVDISVSRREEEEDDELQAVYNVMQVPENNHPSGVHYPEEEVSNRERLESMLNISIEDNLTFLEGELELAEQTEQVDSRLSEETIMRHIQIKYYTPTTTYLNDERDRCVICQNEFECGKFIGGLHCGHKYHVQCIKIWLQQMNNCPICKATAVL